MEATTEEFASHRFDIFALFVLSAEDKLYLGKKRPQLKGKKITSDNKMSKVWKFFKI